MADRDILEVEASRTSPYAIKGKTSRGRRHREPEHPFRTPFQRDRDRIIHSNAFRRLEYKTQVFVYHEGDHYRTRLTHTIEVAQIARTIARALGLNEDAAEAIALAHDLGHPPFGHTGEDTLNELMADRGGFEHNAHGLRIVERLEKRYPAFDGLNLTWEVREGIIKHKSEHDNPGLYDEYEIAKAPCLEAQVVDAADEIAYNNHDLDDGLSSELIDPVSLREVSLWKESLGEVKKKYTGVDPKILRCQTIIHIINRQVTDLVETTRNTIEREGIGSVEDVRKRGSAMARFGPEMEGRNRELKEFLGKNLYNHYRVLRMANKAKRMLGSLFNLYSENMSLLPSKAAADSQGEGEARAVCDYIAGMTDRFAIEEYKKLFDPEEKV